MDKIRDGLYVGNLQDAAGVSDTDRDIRSFDHVITLAERPTDATTEQYAISNFEDDGGLFEDAVDSIRQYMRNDEDVFAHCTVGVSRSGAVVATAIAAEEDWSFDDALAEIKDKVPGVSPHPSLEEQAREYLGEETSDGFF